MWASIIVVSESCLTRPPEGRRNETRSASNFTDYSADLYQVEQLVRS